MSDRFLEILLIQTLSIVPIQLVLFWGFLKYMKVKEKLFIRTLALTGISFLTIELLALVFRGTGFDLIGVFLYVGVITYILRKNLVISSKYALIASISIIVATYILGPIIALTIFNNLANHA